MNDDEIRKEILKELEGLPADEFNDIVYDITDSIAEGINRGGQKSKVDFIIKHYGPGRAFKLMKEYLN